MDIEQQHDKPVYRKPEPPRNLDITSPNKWQMALRVHLEALTGPAAEEWLAEFRLIYSVVSRVVRDRVSHHVTALCFVCQRAFTNGKPEGESGYYDGDRNYVHVYCCSQNEYPQLLMKVKDKEDSIRRSQELADEAVRKAMLDARAAVR